jgi:hypothetical protein
LKFNGLLELTPQAASSGTLTFVHDIVQSSVGASGRSFMSGLTHPGGLLPATLQIDGSKLPTNTIYGFDVGDVIELPNIAATPGIVTSDGNGNLTINGQVLAFRRRRHPRRPPLHRGERRVRRNADHNAHLHRLFQLSGYE